MVLVYTHKITSRSTYVFKHVFEQMLGGKVGFTTKIEEFIVHKGAKLSYTKQQLGNEFFIRSHELLFEHGITDTEVKVQRWDDIPAFFPTDDRSALPYDIFAASFFLLSRYEEYFPFVGDAFGRFPVEESIAHENGFLEMPVIDIWVHRLLNVLLERFPEETLRAPRYKYTPLIDVPSAFVYKKKGFIRTIAGTLIDLANLNFRRVRDRYASIIGIRPDPGNNFSRYTVLHKHYEIEVTFFFLVSDFSAYDHPVSFNINKFRRLIKNVADYDQVALLSSYDSKTNPKKMQEERQRLQELIHKDVKKNRCHLGHLTIPEKYRELVAAEFTEDYSMGYADSVGFRASTCHPFLFYDIGAEMQLPVKVYSPCATSVTLQMLGGHDKVIDKLSELHKVVKRVGGQFIVAYRNTTIGTADGSVGWRELYIETLRQFNHN